MTFLTSTPQTAAWPALLATATILGSLALACVFPFAAFAALAALTLNNRSGLMLVGATWAANQTVGFFLLSFPWDAQAVGHGIAILVATLAGFGVARFAAQRIDQPVLRAGAALGLAFIVYEVLLMAYAQIGGGAENFTPAIIANVARNDALWFAGLMAARALLSRSTGEQLLPARA
jgi:hypothetical protein